MTSSVDWTGRSRLCTASRITLIDMWSIPSTASSQQLLVMLIHHSRSGASAHHQ